MTGFEHIEELRLAIIAVDNRLTALRDLSMKTTWHVGRILAIPYFGPGFSLSLSSKESHFRVAIYVGRGRGYASYKDK